MSILYPEISSSGISSDDFTALSSSTTDINKQVIIYRQFPDFETNPSAIGGRAVGLPFSAVGNSTAVIRAYNNAGSIYAEQYIEGSGWAHNTLISTGLTGIRPILSLPVSGGFDLYLVKSTGYVWKYHSATGSSWSAGSQFTTIAFDNTGNLEWIAFGGGDTSLDTIYGVTKTLYGTRRITALTSTTQYDPGIWYPFPLLGLDCQWLSATPDDTSGDKSNTDIRHVLLISSDTAPILKYKIIGGLPVATTQETGGLMSCIIRPGEPNRGMNSSPLYPVSITDNMASQRRNTAHASSSSSIWGTTTEHDTIWVASYGFNEDINSNDQSYGFPALWYFCSRDGKHWSQDHMLPTDTIASTVDFSHGCTLVKHGNYVYAVTCEGLVRSPGCLEFNNPGTNDQLDITNSVSQYSSSTGDMKQTNITVENEHGRLNNSLLLSQVALGIITKFGNAAHLFQVSIQEIDQIQPDRERPNQAIQISARDYIARLTDRSEAADAIQWDSPIVGRDTYNDIGGVVNSGLAHTSVVQGSFETSSSTLLVKSGYKESIEFYAADKPNIVNGQVSSVFTLPNTASKTPGSTVTNNPTFAGVIFRAFDKSNFWSVRFNYWTQKIEVLERRQGSDLIWYSQAPSSYFLTRATTELSVGLRVEFKHSRIRVWETTQVTATGSIWSFSFEFIANGVLDNSSIVQFAGYVGQIGCGYALTDDSSSSTSDDTSHDSSIQVCTSPLQFVTDGTAFIACDGSHIGIGTGISGTQWVAIPTTGLPADNIGPIVTDPAGSFWNSNSGVAPLWCIADDGVYHYPDAADCTQNWTLVHGISNANAFGGSTAVSQIRADHVHTDQVVVSALLGTTSRQITRFNSSGVMWNIDPNLGADAKVDRDSGLDIGQNGDDHVWYSTRQLGSTYLVQVLNGVPTIKHTFSWAFHDEQVCTFIQIPQKTLTGAANTSTVTPTVLAALLGDDTLANIAISSDGFGTYTEIGRVPHLNPAVCMSSMMAGDDPNVLIISAVPYLDYYGNSVPSNPKSTEEGLWTTSTRGASWHKVTGTSKQNSGRTCGFLADDHNQIYVGGLSSLGYINGLQGTFQSLYGNWSSVFGGVGSFGFHTVIPFRKVS